jgi:pilus assembly protein CpaB
VRVSTIVMIGFAVLFGLLAVFVAQTWLNSQAEQRMKSLEAQKKPTVATTTLVVANKALRYGNDVAAGALKEIPWPSEAIPAGSFSKISDLTATRRVVLTAIEANEPILAWKLTGSGQRATLSATLEPGMKAVTIRVNDVEGVGGFVLPGDRVDVSLTRQIDKGVGTNDVVLQNVKVLAIDQSADERNDKPLIAKSVTIEVDPTSAQKIALATTVGTLSLMLRKAGDASAEATRRITLSDLVTGGQAPKDTRFATIGVWRAAKKDDYSVPTEAGVSTVGAGARGEKGR